jgi:hypothetical protein
MDTAIMGGDQRCGAVARLRTMKQPIHVARDVLEQSPHVCAFSGDAAERMAREAGGAQQGYEGYFATDLRRAQLYRELERQRSSVLHEWQDARSNGTVGAVAMDFGATPRRHHLHGWNDGQAARTDWRQPCYREPHECGVGECGDSAVQFSCDVQMKVDPTETKFTLEGTKAEVMKHEYASS